MISIIITITLSISAYTPQANAISGGRIMANGQAPHAGAFACPSNIPLGSRVTILGAARDRAQRLGIPTDGICADRFAKRYSRGHLDICIPRGYLEFDDTERLKLAREFGRVKSRVVITPSKSR